MGDATLEPLPIPDFLTIPVLTQSLIVETTALDLLPTLTLFTTFTTLSSLFPIPDSRFPDIVNFYFLSYNSIIGIVKGESTDEQVCWYY
ncbi:MAG: hypothetical protein F6K50_20430 [Moorea sp. SIO3I7]|uniref:hypothetical protein n=1 Tax=unclassified Moorena TaxID=2683338 RepID=UPI0013C275FA|nr:MULTISPECIES: hypothetical protein [unclassified Moorena]NEN97800.1 hypothetical protein [Moorena sp. SIO3I7]NEO07245.1 hypothetical protein [Moorena sp. SIO3I8]NEO23002.1 hypothetical protein [Moorena sp. SIO4A5]NEP21498.1 hypothetical protein [Moorena sp. SIO3I6]NEQ61946.1 hypothetical protein [Moorena sp. SIO4A1]